MPIPDELIPDDAKVEMEAKKAAGYFTAEHAPTADELKATVGREDRGILSLARRRRAAALAAVGARPCASARTRCWRPGCAASSQHFTVDLESLGMRRAGRRPS